MKVVTSKLNQFCQVLCIAKLRTLLGDWTGVGLLNDAMVSVITDYDA